MRKNYAIFCLFFSISFCSLANAMSEQSEQLVQQRVWYVDALREAQSGSYATVQKWRQKMGDYPLFPYVELAYLKNHPYLSNKQKIREFLNIYEGTPLEWPLRRPWLEYLAKKGDAITFINDFKATSDAELNCHNLSFQLKIGARIKDIADQIRTLWVVGKSQPKACDTLFEKWTDSGLRTNEMIRERVIKAADGGSHTLIPYLTKLLPKEDRSWAKLWHRVRRNPAVITKHKYFPRQDADYAAIQFYGLKRLIWRDPDVALSHFDKVSLQYPFTEEQLGQLSYRFALALASKGHAESKHWLSRVPAQLKDAKIVHWHLATYLREENWIQVASLIQTLPQNLQSLAINRYWLARAQEQLGIEVTARQNMQELAGMRHYYGFLAAARSDYKYQLNHQSVEIDVAIQEKISQAPAARRAYEFLQLEQFVNARREWYQFKKTLTKTELANAAYLAHQWRWHDQALRAISQAGQNDEVALRFPKAYESIYQKFSKQAGIDFTLALAISRRESTFMADAHSSAGLGD